MAPSMACGQTRTNRKTQREQRRCSWETKMAKATLRKESVEKTRRIVPTRSAKKHCISSVACIRPNKQRKVAEKISEDSSSSDSQVLRSREPLRPQASFRIVNGTPDTNDASPLLSRRERESGSKIVELRTDFQNTGNESDDSHRDDRSKNLEVRNTLKLSNRRQGKETPQGRDRTISPGMPATHPIEGTTNATNQESMLSSDMATTVNNLKVDLLEVQRDKRVYASHIVALKEKCDAQRLDLQLKNQQVSALEMALSKKTRRSNNGKGHVWSTENLQDSGIACYQGIILTSARYGTNLAKLIVTERFMDGTQDDAIRRDWTGSATELSSDAARQAALFVTLPNNILAIPTVSMARAQEMQFYTCRVDGSKGFLQLCLSNVLQGPVGGYMSDEQKKECACKIMSHRKTNQKFRAILSDATGNRKKAAKQAFLKSLGYKHSLTPVNKKDGICIREARQKEKETIVSRCVKILDNDVIDTSFWRTADWDQLCLLESFSDVASDLLKTEEKLEKDGVVDNLFFNDAARRAFFQLRGYSISQDKAESEMDFSLITIARADACMTTILKCITLQGKGGSRNEAFVRLFQDLLPKALACIIKDIWCDIKDIAEHELMLHIGNSGEHDNDPFDNNLRDWTVVLRNPQDSHIYLLATPKYFQQKVCSWIGKAKDAQIGRYDESEGKFQMITETMSFTQREDSDVDEPSNNERLNSQDEDLAPCNSSTTSE